MQVSIDRTGAYTVTITGGNTGPYVTWKLSPDEAYNLLQALDAKRGELRDLAINFYTCPECANTHLNLVKRCPNIGQEE